MSKFSDIDIAVTELKQTAKEMSEVFNKSYYVLMQNNGDVFVSGMPTIKGIETKILAQYFQGQEVTK